MIDSPGDDAEPQHRGAQPLVVEPPGDRARQGVARPPGTARRARPTTAAAGAARPPPPAPQRGHRPDREERRERGPQLRRPARAAGSSPRTARPRPPPYPRPRSRTRRAAGCAAAARTPARTPTPRPPRAPARPTSSAISRGLDTATTQTPTGVSSSRPASAARGAPVDVPPPCRQVEHSGITNPQTSIEPGISSGANQITNGAATTTIPKPTLPCTRRRPARRSRAAARGRGWVRAPRQRSRGLEARRRSSSHLDRRARD